MMKGMVENTNAYAMPNMNNYSYMYANNVNNKQGFNAIQNNLINTSQIQSPNNFNPQKNQLMNNNLNGTNFNSMIQLNNLSINNNKNNQINFIMNNNMINNNTMMNGGVKNNIMNNNLNNMNMMNNNMVKNNMNNMANNNINNKMNNNVNNTINNNINNMINNNIMNSNINNNTMMKNNFNMNNMMNNNNMNNTMNNMMNNNNMNNTMNIMNNNKGFNQNNLINKNDKQNINLNNNNNNFMMSNINKVNNNNMMNNSNMNMMNNTNMNMINNNNMMNNYNMNMMNMMNNKNMNMNNNNNINMMNNNNMNIKMVYSKNNNMNNNMINNNQIKNNFDNSNNAQFQINYDYKKKNNDQPIQKSINNDIDTDIDNSLNNEINLIKDKINTEFTNEQLSQLHTEADVLQFFAQKENICNEFINDSFGGYEDLKNIMIKQIEDIFKNNPNKVIIDNIYYKLNNIPIEQLNSENEYYKKLKEVFGIIQLPQFLIEDNIKNLRCILFYQNQKVKSTTIVGKMKNKDYTHESKRIIEFYEKQKNKEINALEGINRKFELFYLLLNINCEVFQKPYCAETFFSFIEANIQPIKQYFGQNISYNEIFDNFRLINKEKINDQKEYLFQIIDNDINGSTDKIFNIIASLFYLFFYVFKDPKLYNEISNIGNVYINLIIKNFVIFLDQQYKNRIKLGKNLFELLQELYLPDINYLIGNGFYPSLNKSYNFIEIDSLLMSDNLVCENYKYLKDNFAKNQNDMDGFFTLIRKNLGNLVGKGEELTQYENNIKLIPLDENVYSNTITILIDGFTTEDKNQVDQWRDLIHFFEKETIFYFFKWPSDSKDNILKNGIWKAINNASKHFAAAKKRAKICGKMLAYILMSTKFFNNFQINLIGFSLGNHVIKNCLKELKKINNYNNFIKIKNVILIAAATHISNKHFWSQVIDDIVIDKFVNCFSQKDDILKYMYGMCMLKSAEGRNKLEIVDEKGRNVIINYDFTQHRYGHLSYNYGIVMKTIFKNYKDI